MRRKLTMMPPTALEVEQDLQQCTDRVATIQERLRYLENEETTRQTTLREIDYLLSGYPSRIEQAHEQATLAYGLPSEPAMIEQLRAIQAEQAQRQQERALFLDKQQQREQEESTERQQLLSELATLQDTHLQLSAEHRRLISEQQQREYEQAEMVYSAHIRRIEGLAQAADEAKRIATTHAANLAQAITTARGELHGEQLRRFNSRYPELSPLDRLTSAYEHYLNSLVVEAPQVAGTHGFDALLGQIIERDEMYDAAAGSQGRRIQLKRRNLVA